MFEIIDCFVTNVLTFMVYGVPVCVGIAFIHFVVTHPTLPEDKPSTATEVSQPQAAVKPSYSTIDASADPLALTTNEPMEPEANSSELTCVPIDWSLWKTQDLRNADMRKAFGIKGRANGRACRKSELISQYAQAIGYSPPVLVW